MTAKKDQGVDFKLNKDKKQLEFKINTKIYPLAAVYRASYLFLDKAYIFLDGEPLKEIKVFFKGKSSVAPKGALEDLEELAGEFYNELLNQLLREKISETNKKVREYIVAKALYSAVPNEVDELLKEVEDDDWQKDPLEIAKTWDEQNKES